ncbi:low molecular weight protein arginine phosphatase [Synoicihabitans lomoniglobus]|uniref:protein-tyrosine-phosphatase n=1 Tax=Synoicihabitans lomoniglobus TaxID=2909285 RepID=A0AAF0I453_9BACT|nr:low molecular weight protein arginine phosphatase [Opitutaceae bacterium LMO-M01]WED67437.1 low molecular weight protein arginine phosphatase [Opitutaceae bacterium LMO-M01]
MADQDTGLLLAVCTANICRSPMVEALLAHALKVETGALANLKVASAGVAARNGDPASANSVEAMRKVGLDISGHRSQALTAELLEQATAVFVMTETHRAIIQATFDPTPRNVFLLREFMPRDADKQIADPFGGPLPLYEGCRDEIVESIPSVMAFLRKELA